MARRTKQVVKAGEKPDWFLKEWMQTLGVKQSELAASCDWTRGTMHGIYHGRTEYYREVVNLVAEKLNIQPYELMMPPDLAMAYRRLRQDAMRIVEGGPDFPTNKPREVGRTGTDD